MIVGEPLVKQDLGLADLGVPVDVAAIDVVIAHRAVVLVHKTIAHLARISRSDGRVERAKSTRRVAQLPESLLDLGIGVGGLSHRTGCKAKYGGNRCEGGVCHEEGLVRG
jgi:hypothetical protein